MDLAHELGAYSFYTGRTMYTGNAVKAWRHIAAVRGAVRRRSSPRCTRRPRSIAAACAFTSTRWACSRSCATGCTSGRAADRAAQRPGEAHQRAAVRLRRLAHAVAGRRSGRTSSARGRTRASPRFVDDLARRSAAGRDAAPVGPSLTDAAAPVATAPTPRAASAARRVEPGALPLLPLCGPAALPARRGVGVRGRGPFDAAVFWSGLARRRPRGRRRRSVQRILRRARWAPTASSIPPTCRRSPTVVFWIGVVAFAGALAVGVYLTVRGGWPILAFALLGGAAAIFYEAPPIRWSYRGLGEAVIALSYGPWMVLGSLYLHTHALSWRRVLGVAAAGLLIMALAVVNAIPDFHQDRLVGKRNLVVRLGRRRAVSSSTSRSAAAGLAVVPVGVAARSVPARLPRCAPRAFRCSSPADAARCGTYETPRRFVPAMRRHRRVLRRGAGLFVVGIAHRRRAMSAMTQPHRCAAGAALRLVAAHARLRPLLPSLLHRVRAGQAPARRARRRRGDARRRRDRSQRRAVRDAVRRRAAGRAAFPRNRGGARARRRSAQDRDQRPAPRRCDSRAARPAADPLDPDQPRRRYRGDLPAAAAGRLARPGARGLPRGTRLGCRWRSRSRPRPSTSTSCRRCSRAPPRLARSASTPAS